MLAIFSPHQNTASCDLFWEIPTSERRQTNVYVVDHHLWSAAGVSEFSVSDSDCRQVDSVPVASVSRCGRRLSRLHRNAARRVTQEPGCRRRITPVWERCWNFAEPVGTRAAQFHGSGTTGRGQPATQPLSGRGGEGGGGGGGVERDRRHVPGPTPTHGEAGQPVTDGASPPTRLSRGRRRRR